MNTVDELIRLHAKQLKIPSFAEYHEVLRQADPSAGFSDILLELMKAETLSRQENQNRRRLKAAGFPYLKTMEEFDVSQLSDAVSPLFLQELASCQFVQNKQNVIMIGNPGRDGVADKKLDSRRRQLNVHKRAGRNGAPRI